MFQHVLVTAGRADGGHNAFADAGDDGFFRRAANETLQMRAHGHTRLGLDDDAVLGHPVNGDFAGGGIRTVDDLRINGGFHGFEDGFAGAFGRQINGASAVELKADAGLVFWVVGIRDNECRKTRASENASADEALVNTRLASG